MPITYEQIKSANERIARIEIKGKKYACVAERVQAFREICPDGSIETSVQLVPDDKGMICLATTIIRDETGKVLAQDNAYEREGSTQINRTSFVENACTSSIGRATASLGLGSETSMASAEEMANALHQQMEATKAEEKAAVENAKAAAEYKVSLLAEIADLLDGHDAVRDQVNASLNKMGCGIAALPTARLESMKAFILRQIDGAEV